MKPLLVPLAIALLSLVGLSCSNTHAGAGSTSQVSSSAAPRKRSAALSTSSIASAKGALLGDGDADNPKDIDGDNGDGSEDHDDDSRTRESYNYHDRDDQEILGFGHAADAADKRAIAPVVGLYYTAAAAGDGAKACSLIVPSIARSVPEDYGSGAGPSYLRGGKTCQAVVSMLFKHSHKLLGSPVKVTDVRVNGSQAEVLVGSRTMLASYIGLTREAGVWKIAELLGGVLP